MSVERYNDLVAFRGFIDQKLSDGGGNLTPDEVLAEWEFTNQSDHDRAETLNAVRKGIEDIEAGRSRPARDVMVDLCRKYNLADPTQ